ncbi:beta-ketoacyl synthase N-terminal-like domain-containing protein [Flavobacterium sp. 20NA77.7]|uniref:Beta-ketoacyl synthase N-terminal-like domain-containing protein n=1 Tax=Flavobacterium nakdongensis TaxID=3073563 RepID=A0ABY9RBC2_9FLAO|nr:beta-ketoacyl synthase N-terminal-like domain-containing protein [Flavobacterium sp. 20NA77.7]WMW78094.1 beta-ketoacyl synthase N-terminal-like domain-containing protein [Flavobacterium sp. 20NA77.7]
MLKQPVYIHSLASISALGSSKEEVWKNYLHPKALFSTLEANEKDYLVSKLSIEDNAYLTKIALESKYKHIDKTVLLGLAVARKAISQIEIGMPDLGVNFSSSRGATSLFEQYFEEFYTTKKVTTYTSPATTLGNISSWIAHDLQTRGPELSHSITCSSGLHSILNAIAWLQAGLVHSFLVGASEAPLTPFTLAQLEALKVYTQEKNDLPCRALDFEKTKNSMVLGEGAVAIVLSLKDSTYLAKIVGMGYATEVLSSATSISSEAECFQKSMKMAIGNLPLESIDAIIMHAPGTILGDQSEREAIVKVFGQQQPLLTSNKWKVGHTFATSGLLSIELAILMLEKQQFISSPFYPQQISKPLKRILVNAVGFGGNAVSILIEK